MQLPIDQLLKRITYCVDHMILPDLSSPYLRAQAMAISSSLNNLAARLSALDQILLDQNRSLRDIIQSLDKTLGACVEIAKDESSMGLRQKIQGQLAKKYTTKQPLADENYDLKLLLEEIIATLWEIEHKVTIQDLKEIHGQIRHFLKQEVETELGLLTLPDMARVSKG